MFRLTLSLLSNAFKNQSLNRFNSIGIALKHSKAEAEAQRSLDELYWFIRAQKFEDVVVIQTKSNSDPRYLILANAFSNRHLISGTEMINKHYKQSVKTDEQEFAKNCRQYYDIEQLWAVGEDYDDLTNFPPEITNDPLNNYIKSLADP